MDEIVRDASLREEAAPDSPLVLVSCWYAVAGPIVARRCPPVRLEGRTLVVASGAGGMDREIARHEAELVAGLRAAGLRLDAIRCE